MGTGKPQRIAYATGWERQRKRKEQLKALLALAGPDPVCHICRAPLYPLFSPPPSLAPSIDHLVPQSQGGTDDIENLALAHMICNTQRSLGE